MTTFQQWIKRFFSSVAVLCVMITGAQVRAVPLQVAKRGPHAWKIFSAFLVSYGVISAGAACGSAATQVTCGSTLAGLVVATAGALVADHYRLLGNDKINLNGTSAFEKHILQTQGPAGIGYIKANVLVSANATHGTAAVWKDAAASYGNETLGVKVAEVLHRDGSHIAVHYRHNPLVSSHSVTAEHVVPISKAMSYKRDCTNTPNVACEDVKNNGGGNDAMAWSFYIDNGEDAYDDTLDNWSSFKTRLGPATNNYSPGIWCVNVKDWTGSYLHSMEGSLVYGNQGGSAVDSASLQHAANCNGQTTYWQGYAY